MNKVVLILGSNVGERIHQLQKAMHEINRLLGKPIQQSSIYETAAWGYTNQGKFLNQVIVILSDLSADEIMNKILVIEEELGRKRTIKWEPRIIDIDILFFNDEIICTKELVIPHPNLHERKFTLIPLEELMPGYIHPVLKKSISDLLLEINDTLDVKKTSYHFA